MPEITAEKGTAFCDQADVTDPASLEQFIAHAASRHNGIDVLVNAFGRIDAADAVRFEATDPAAWDELFRVDVRGTFLACQAALPYLRAAEAPVIVISPASRDGTDQENLVNSVSVSFCAAKGAVRGFTAALARDLAPHIRVNAISPGMIAANWDADWKIPAHHLDNAKANTPLRRIGTREDRAQRPVPGVHRRRLHNRSILQVDGGWLMPG